MNNNKGGEFTSPPFFLKQLIMPGGSKKGGGLKTKKSAFYLRSGNSPLFKNMGSSPLEQEGKPQEVGGKIATKEVVKQVVKKGAGKTISRAIPVIGEALMVGDIIKRGVQNIKEGKQTLYKEAKGVGGKTWAERQEEGKSNVWG